MRHMAANIRAPAALQLAAVNACMLLLLLLSPTTVLNTCLHLLLIDSAALIGVLICWWSSGADLGELLQSRTWRPCLVVYVLAVAEEGVETNELMKIMVCDRIDEWNVLHRRKVVGMENHSDLLVS